MFENVLFQDKIVSRLKHDIIRETLPPALVFSGPVNSGKLTAALELARVLSCKNDGRWTCGCRHCSSHRLLLHQRTVIAGSRNLMPEITAAYNVFINNASDVSRFLFVRAVRKLLRRFDPFLWEGEERKIKQLIPVMEKLSENLDSIQPGSGLPGEKKLDKIMKDLMTSCAKIQAALPPQLPVQQIRHITGWAVHTSSGDHKTIIIDHAERMQEGAKNAMLKFLEEPPEDTTVILITKNKSMLLPTITSRVRDYPFSIRKPSEEAGILKKIFKTDEDTAKKGLTDFFRSCSSEAPDRIKELAVLFLDFAEEGRDFLPKNIPEEIKDTGTMIVFLEVLGLEMERRWKNGNKLNKDYQKGYEELKLLRESRTKTEILNIQSSQVLKWLYLSLRTLYA
jgi:DNA polymerase-3 subunit gamma/tau